MNVSHIHALYLLGQRRESAPSLAMDFFGGEKDPGVIRERFGRVKSRHPDYAARLKPAYHSALVGALITGGDLRTARQVTDRISREDPFISLLNSALRDANLTFSGECLKAGELLAPSSLDGRVLQAFAPESAREGAGFANGTGVAIITPQSYELCSVDLNYITLRHSHMELVAGNHGLEVEHLMLVANKVSKWARQSEAHAFITESFKNSGVDEYAVISLDCIDGIQNKEYFLRRFTINAVGKAAEEVAGQPIRISRAV